MIWLRTRLGCQRLQLQGLWNMATMSGIYSPHFLILCWIWLDLFELYYHNPWRTMVGLALSRLGRAFINETTYLRSRHSSKIHRYRIAAYHCLSAPEREAVFELLAAQSAIHHLLPWHIIANTSKRSFFKSHWYIDLQMHYRIVMRSSICMLTRNARLKSRI